MPIQFQGSGGEQGELDVASAIQSNGGTFRGVEHGIVLYADRDGKPMQFSLAQWAESSGAQITGMDAYNSPDTAIQTPPNGMTALDQAVFYMDGADMGSLQQLYPRSQKLPDGRYVVLDNDGFWKEMWASDWQAPPGPKSYDQQAADGNVVDITLGTRLAGVQFLMALAGVEAKTDRKKNFKVSELCKALDIIAHNAPEESKILVGQLVYQLTGLDPFKFKNALYYVPDTEHWLNLALKMTSFEFRMHQVAIAELVMKGMHQLATHDMIRLLSPMREDKAVTKIMINMKEISGEFISFLNGMNIVKDISRITGLHDLIALGHDTGMNTKDLPDMHAFVPKFVRLLKWMMPMAQESQYAIARGQAGFDGCLAMLTMTDDCLFALAYVPECAAKFKLFMALRKIQASVETKLAFFFQPSPEQNKDGMKQNPFMLAKEQYKQSQETVYKLLQVPKEAWANTFLEYVKSQQVLDSFYQSMPGGLSTLMKSFVAMDAAYDMQPWVDANHAVRTNDAFSQLHESFGLPPPEAGYLAKNSPRAAQNIMQTLAQSSGMLTSMTDKEIRELLRNPLLLGQFIKMVQAASVNREVGAIEIMSKMGMGPEHDIHASPDAHRIWEDPQQVQADNARQVQEMMGQMAMQAMQQKQQTDSAGAQQQMASDQQPPQQAGPGPNGPPANVVPMRSANGARR